MGRPERDVDAESGPVAQLARQLRVLRQSAGTPSYRAMAGRANYSATMLSRAASGRELPSLPVVLAYVTACGGDPEEWEARYQGVARQLAPGPVATPATGAKTMVAVEVAQPPVAVSGRSRGTGVRRAVNGLAVGTRPWTLSALLAVAAVAGWTTAFAANSRPVGSAAATPLAVMVPARLSDGNDPTESRCAADAVTVAQATARLAAASMVAGAVRQPGTAVGLVELRYSARCHAAWARATPSPAYNVASLGAVTVTIARRGDGTYSSFRVAVMTVVYGDLLLTRGGCLTAAAEFRFSAAVSAPARTACWTAP